MSIKLSIQHCIDEFTVAYILCKPICTRVCHIRVYLSLISEQVMYRKLFKFQFAVLVVGSITLMIPIPTACTHNTFQGERGCLTVLRLPIAVFRIFSTTAGTC